MIATLMASAMTITFVAPAILSSTIVISFPCHHSLKLDIMSITEVRCDST